MAISMNPPPPFYIITLPPVIRIMYESWIHIHKQIHTNSVYSLIASNYTPDFSEMCTTVCSGKIKKRHRDLKYIGRSPKHYHHRLHHLAEINNDGALPLSNHPSPFRLLLLSMPPSRCPTLATPKDRIAKAAARKHHPA